MQPSSVELLGNASGIFNYVYSGLKRNVEFNVMLKMTTVNGNYRANKSKELSAFGVARVSEMDLCFDEELSPTHVNGGITIFLEPCSSINKEAVEKCSNISFS